jgi:hypothetical protein
MIAATVVASVASTVIATIAITLLMLDGVSSSTMIAAVPVVTVTSVTAELLHITLFW